ncbi:MAG: hypothetical protein AAAFM81_14810 [Pseudomonadota bacterium]
MSRRGWIAGASFVALSAITAASPVAHAVDYEGELGASARWFVQSTDDPRQSVQDFSVSGELRLNHRFDDRRQSFDLAITGRIDSDDGERSQWDIGTLTWRYQWRHAAVSVGLDKVFWGTTESLHLVDVINQTNRVDELDGDSKLGQPMLRLSFTPGRHELDLFVLPRFREQRLPGSRGRLRGPLQLIDANPGFESDKGNQHLDLAVRYGSYIGGLSYALSHFSGTARTPLLRLSPSQTPFELPTLRPLYFLTDRTGLELSLVTGDWLWKLEALSARDDLQRYLAAVGGFELTLPAIAGTSMDLGLILEYQYDSRSSDRLLQSVSVANDDLVAGLRIGANDFAGSELLALYSYDRQSNGRIASIEASRRFGNNWRGSLEARFFSGQSDVDALSVFANEDHWQLTITRFF